MEVKIMPPKAIDCSDPMYQSGGIVTAYTPITITTTTYNPIPKLDLSGWNSAINITPNNITFACDKEQKEYIEKLEKHIDELEEDIDFLDKMRKGTEDELAFHVEKIGEFTTKISHLEDENTKLRADLDNLYGQFYTLLQRLDNQ
jgi:peptidoglycan hydrolase CwlO-like protein